MTRILIFVYGLVAYLAFVATFLYAIGFVGDLVVPKSVDGGPAPGSPGIAAAVVINILLLGLFAVQHTIMARPAFKARWTKLVPWPMERSTFVLATCAVFAILFWGWQPLPAVVWDIQHPAGRAVMWGLFGLGFAIVLYSSWLIDHFDLFGMRQVTLHLLGRAYHHRPFSERSLYRLVRHPLMLGFLIAFWSAPTMTAGHLLFAGVTTAYILVAIRIEEHDLIGHLGDAYRNYRQRTPALVPVRKKF